MLVLVFVVCVFAGVALGSHNITAAQQQEKVVDRLLQVEQIAGKKLFECQKKLSELGAESFVSRQRTHQLQNELYRLYQLCQLGSWRNVLPVLDLRAVTNPLEYGRARKLTESMDLMCKQVHHLFE